jgi:hypothetical protein
MMYELNQDFGTAIKSYEQAILTTMSNEKIKEFQGDIERCKIKAGISRNSKPWFSFKRK